MHLKHYVKKFLFIGIIILLLIILFLLGFHFLIKEPSSSYSDNKNNITENKKEVIETYKASLIATGDGLVHSNVYNAAYDSYNKTYNFKDMLTLTKEKLQNYDIKYYNQETVFDKDSPLSNYPRFNTPSSFGLDMLDAGFNLVSLATNHSLDKGRNGAYNSALWWQEQDNILASGMSTSEEERAEYKIREVNGITYTMLSYTYGTNGLGGNILKEEPFLVNLFDEEQVLEDIKAVRSKVDVLIIAMHWGVEYKQDATETQRKQAQFLADNGADIILGTHSHCIEPFEMIDDTPVFYSLGNFISGQNHPDNTPFIRKITSIGMFATMDIIKTVSKSNNTSTITIANIGADLNYNYKFYNQEKKKYDYLVIPFSKMEHKYLDNYEEIYNEFSQVLTKYDHNIKIEPLPSNI